MKFFALAATLRLFRSFHAPLESRSLDFPHVGQLRDGDAKWESKIYEIQMITDNR
jgi:hypothetical protein